jgi:hypothetical protein
LVTEDVGTDVAVDDDVAIDEAEGFVDEATSNGDEEE